MELTNEYKRHIDAMSYRELLEGWRNAPTDSRWFQGETGEYWGIRMAELWDEQQAATNKSISWK